MFENHQLHQLKVLSLLLQLLFLGKFAFGLAFAFALTVQKDTTTTIDHLQIKLLMFSPLKTRSSFSMLKRNMYVGFGPQRSGHEVLFRPCHLSLSLSTSVDAALGRHQDSNSICPWRFSGHLKARRSLSSGGLVSRLSSLKTQLAFQQELAKYWQKHLCTWRS